MIPRGGAVIYEHLSAQLLKNTEDSLPAFVNTLVGVPKCANTRSKKTIAANSVDFWDEATSSIHLLKYSIITNTYFAPRSVTTNGLAKSGDQR